MRGVINLTAPSDRSQALRQAARRWCVHAQETGQSPHTFNPMTSIKSLATAAASVAAGATVLAFSGPAANANTFGLQGGCDSSSVTAWGNGAGINVDQRDCDDHRDWLSKEARLDRRHQTQGQLIGIGGNILTGLINNSQNRQQSSSAELALQRQQQEIELLKLQLQLQQQQQQQAAYGVQNVGNYGPVVQPAYPYGYQQQNGYYQQNQYGYTY